MRADAVKGRSQVGQSCRRTLLGVGVVCRPMRGTVWVLTGVLWGALHLASALAHPPEPPPPKERLKRLIQTLDLDAPTAAAVTKIVETAEPEHRELRRQLWEAHRRMRTLLQQDTPDEAAIMAQAEAIGALRTAVRKLRLRTMLQIRALLTPEQRQRLREQFSTWRPRRPPVFSPRATPQRGESGKGSTCGSGVTEPDQ